VFYFTCNHRQWLHVKYNNEIISQLFQNNFISHVTATLGKPIACMKSSRILCLLITVCWK